MVKILQQLNLPLLYCSGERSHDLTSTGQNSKMCVLNTAEELREKCDPVGYCPDAG